MEQTWSSLGQPDAPLIPERRLAAAVLLRTHNDLQGTGTVYSPRNVNQRTEAAYCIQAGGLDLWLDVLSLGGLPVDAIDEQLSERAARALPCLTQGRRGGHDDLIA